ncbi:MAG: hypothetical protein QXD43_00980 [Candidatus Aenigmatarchaeota archaeon]
MAEEIKKTLFYCSYDSNHIPYVCIKSSLLTSALQKIKELSFKEFLEVFNYINKLNLPKEFKDEVRFEANIRGYKV